MWSMLSLAGSDSLLWQWWPTPLGISLSPLSLGNHRSNQTGLVEAILESKLSRLQGDSGIVCICRYCDIPLETACTGKRSERQVTSTAHSTAARRSSRPVGQRSERLKQNAAAAASKAAETSKPAKKKSLIVDKSFPLPDNFGYMVCTCVIPVPFQDLTLCYHA